MKLALTVLGCLALTTASLTAAPIVYTAFLDGPSEAPPNASPGTGFARVTIDTATHTMRVEANFTGLIGTSTNAHIHCCTATPFTLTAGVATQTPTFPGFPSGVTSGSYDSTFDLTLGASWNSAFVTANGGTPAGAEAALATGLAEGRAYFNLHSSLFTGGEIRGFLEPVPEPATAALAGCTVLALIAIRHRCRRA